MHMDWKCVCDHVVILICLCLLKKETLRSRTPKAIVYFSIMSL